MPLFLENWLVFVYNVEKLQHDKRSVLSNQLIYLFITKLVQYKYTQNVKQKIRYYDTHRESITKLTSAPHNTETAACLLLKSNMSYTTLAMGPADDVEV